MFIDISELYPTELETGFTVNKKGTCGGLPDWKLRGYCCEEDMLMLGSILYVLPIDEVK